LVEVLALKKEEGDAVLKEEGLKDGSWAPSLSAFTALDSFMGRGRMGGEEEVGEIYTKGDVFAEEDWGPPIDNSGEKERDNKGGGNKEGDVRRRSKRDSKITPRMAAFMGKENRGSKAKAAATTRHDGGGREEVGESNMEGDVPATKSSANPGVITHEGRHPYVFREGELVNVNNRKASHQAEIVSIKDEMATVKWKTWKGQAEVKVNQLSLICDGSKRKRKQTDRFGDVDTTKKLKPDATTARSELSTLLCNVCHCDVCHCNVWCKNNFLDLSLDEEEEDAEESLVPKEIEESLIIWKKQDQEEVARKREAAAAIIDFQRVSAKEIVLLEWTNVQRIEDVVIEDDGLSWSELGPQVSPLVKRDPEREKRLDARVSYCEQTYWRWHLSTF
jgi:hypothetical protein